MLYLFALSKVVQTCVWIECLATLAKFTSPISETRFLFRLVRCAKIPLPTSDGRRRL